MEYNFKDKRNREWECFVDICYYDMICVRPMLTKDFNDGLSFHFATTEKAEQFIELLKESF